MDGIRTDFIPKGVEVTVVYRGQTYGTLWQGGEGEIDVEWAAPPLSEQANRPGLIEGAHVALDEFDAEARAYFEGQGDFEKVLQIEMWRYVTKTKVTTDDSEAIVAVMQETLSERVIPEPVELDKNARELLALARKNVPGFNVPKSGKAPKPIPVLRASDFRSVDFKVVFGQEQPEPMLCPRCGQDVSDCACSAAWDEENRLRIDAFNNWNSSRAKEL